MNNKMNSESLILLNGVFTPIKVGDKYTHRVLGEGFIEKIDVRKESLFPITMSFNGVLLHTKFNIFGQSEKYPGMVLYIYFPYMKVPLKENTKSTLSWDEYFLKIARITAEKSKDPSTKVGAVICDPFNVTVSTGYNGFAQKIPDNAKFLNDRDQKYPRIIHAELNAILFSRRDLSGCTIYTWPMPPCAKCASIIIQTGITKVVSIAPSEELLQRWEADFNMAMQDFISAKVEVTFLKLD